MIGRGRGTAPLLCIPGSGDKDEDSNTEVRNVIIRSSTFRYKTSPLHQSQVLDPGGHGRRIMRHSLYIFMNPNVCNFSPRVSSMLSYRCELVNKKRLCCPATQWLCTGYVVRSQNATGCSSSCAIVIVVYHSHLISFSLYKIYLTASVEVHCKSRNCR